MNVNKRCIRWSFTLNQNTREKLHLSIFLPPVLSLEYLRTSTSFLETKKKHIHHVSAQVNAEDGDCSQRKGYVCNDEDQERRDFRNVTGQGVGNRLLQVIKDQTP